MDLGTISWWGIPATGAVVAVVELLKRAGLDSRWAGVAAVVVAVVGNLAATYWADSPVATALAQGIILGLAASGLWSTVKHVAGR